MNPRNASTQLREVVQDEQIVSGIQVGQVSALVEMLVTETSMDDEVS